MQQAHVSRLPVRLHVTLHSIAFLLGVSSVFIALGFTAGLVSDFLWNFGGAVRIIAGVFLVFFGLLMLRVIPIPLLQRDLRSHMANKPSGYLGSGLVGLAFGAGWSPCIGPILGGIIAIAGSQGSAIQGGILLSIYSLGFAIPFLIAAQVLPSVRKLNRYVGVIEKIGGVLLIIVGALLLFNGVNALSPFLASLGSLESLLPEMTVLPGEQIPASLYPVALLAGTLSFLSPCVLPILPSFLAYLTGMNADALLNN